MIVSRIIGGLGNQMFQYAAGFAVAEHIRSEHRVDVSAFGRYSLRENSLIHLNITSASIDDDDYPPIKTSCEGFVEERRGLRTVRESGMRFDPSLFETGDDLFLFGYWQTESYFKSVESKIRSEFQVKTEPDAENRNLLAQIRDSQSVAVHIRRGDYVSHRKVRKEFGSCTLRYYEGAIRLIKDRVADATFFVFSDEPEWAQAHLNIERSKYVTHNSGNRDFEDLRLMASCRHFIIANSSFSWWAAWLGAEADKTVIAPKPWFLSAKYDSRDVVPRGWMSLPGHAPLALMRARFKGMLRR